MKNLMLLAALLAVIACSQPQETEQEEISQGDSTIVQQYFPIDGEFAGSHILIAWEGAQRAKPGVTRTKEDALVIAQQLLERLKEDPSLLPTLAEQESDGPSGPRGGYLGGWQKGAMVPAFQEGVESVAVGELVPEPVESAFGYHVIRREPLELRHYGCLALFIPYKGSPRVPATVTREKEEAKTIADEVAATINADNFEELALKHNELNGDKGAFNMAVMTERDDVPFPVVETLGAIAFGDITGPIETEIGYAFFKRSKVAKYAGSHILIAYAGAAQTTEEITRTQEEARAKAAELIVKLQQDPTQFEVLAKENSDGPSNARGGDLGTWFKGRMVPAFDEAVSQMNPGAIVTEPVETEFGFHIIRRNPIDGDAEGRVE